LSGIVGIFARDGAPVDRSRLRSLTQFQSFRGPDASEVWADGSVGFGHTLLRTTYESLAESQPANLDRQFWITADARIDCRAELEAELTNAGPKLRQGAPDSELILHSYAAWGEACVQHLRGDFAFAIWDVRRRTLFCARDHFGVKPFYYAELGEIFLFTNTLNCLRLHPDVSEELNDSAIADFLLFGMNCDLTTSTYRDIRRLPPAHCLTVSTTELHTRCYWTPPTDGRIRYHRPNDYVEHFQTLMQAAVADRLRTPRAGIWLSGGMDSSSIAATARQLCSKSGGSADLRAYTVVYDSLIPDRERDHARKVAEFLGIPIRCFAIDDYQLFERWDDPAFAFPEPVEDPIAAALFDHHAAVASDCRVVLAGDGGDELMYFQMWPYTRDLLRNRHWRPLFQDISQFLRLRQFPSRGIRRRIQRIFGRDSNLPGFPSWLDPQLSRRLRLEERWNDLTAGERATKHPIVPKAHASLSGPRWTRLFELADPGLTHATLEVRYPFFDLRVVNYLLAIPPFPWTFQKRLLREAASGHLPESVRLRPKTPLDGDPLIEILQCPDAAWVDHARWSEQIGRYIRPGALPRLNGQKDSVCAGVAVRAHCLNFWLQSSRGVRYNNYAEARSG
jgi:asparagine synthase (glutamine-hydrolysing)